MTFDNLDGIPVHKTLEHGPGDIENIFDVFASALRELTGRKFDMQYEAMYRMIEGLPVSAALIQQFILIERDRDIGKNETYTRGLFSAVLLHRLAETAPEQPVLFDGHGGRFDQLFHGAQYTPPTVVRNFSGHGLCADIGHKGRASVTGIDLSGEWLFASAGHNGDAAVAAIRCSGGAAFYDAGGEGRFSLASYDTQGNLYAESNYFTGDVRIRSYRHQGSLGWCGGWSKAPYRRINSRIRTALDRKIISVLERCAEDPLGAGIEAQRLARTPFSMLEKCLGSIEL